MESRAGESIWKLCYNTPMINTELLLDITGLTKEGAGVAKEERGVVFVPGALPGERVRAEVIKQAKNYRVARVLERLTSSPERVEPACPYFARCGGCTLLHVSYQSQLDLKLRETGEVLRRLSGLPIQVSGIEGMQNPAGYRNKSIYPIARSKGGRVRIGFYRPRSHELVDISACLAAHPQDALVLQIVRGWMEEYGIEPYSEADRTGTLRHLITRRSYAENTLMVLLVTAKKPNHLPALLSALQKVPGLQSVQLNFNASTGNVILGKRCELLFGSPVLYDTLCGIRFPVSPLSFAQVNPEMAQKLYAYAAELAGEQPAPIVDAYAGIGVLTLLLARRAPVAAGVEILPAAVENARQCAADNNIPNATFYEGDCAALLPSLMRTLSPGLLVLDPPRAGVEEGLLAAIGQIGPPRLIYISCDPATLARDLQRLSAFGYTPGPARLFDMFPGTGHIECVTLMSRVKE